MVLTNSKRWTKSEDIIQMGRLALMALNHIQHNHWDMYHKCKRLKNQQQYLKTTMNTPACHNRPNTKPIFLKKGNDSETEYL